MTDPISDMIILQMYTDVDRFLESHGGVVKAAIVYQSSLLAKAHRDDFKRLFHRSYMEATYNLVRFISADKNWNMPQLTFLEHDDISVHRREHDKFWLVDLMPSQLERWKSELKRNAYTVVKL